MTVIFETIVGSRLYGVNMPDSDTDVKGLFIPTLEEYFGVDAGKNFEVKTINNGEPEGPTKVEGTYHSVKSFFKLACVGNPNLLEVVFAAPEFHRVCLPVAKKVLEFGKVHFLTKKIMNSYFAYFNHELKTIQTVPSENSKDRRKILYDTYGYDTKAAGHAYRLGHQALQILTERTLNPTLTGNLRNEVIDMRSGRYEKKEAIEMLKSVYAKMQKAEESCSLPDKPDTATINKFLVEFHRSFYGACGV